MIFKLDTFKTSTLLCLLLASPSVFATDSYLVSTAIFEKNEQVAKPTMIINPNEEALITIDSGLQYGILVTPRNEHTANVTTMLTINDAVAENNTLIAYGKEATVDLEGKRFALLVQKVTD